MELLEVSRILSGGIQLHQEDVDGRGIVRQALETARPLINEHEHELSMSLPAEPIWLHADPIRLEQVIVNLLNNAAKYTPQGGHIWLSLQQDRDEAVLSVRDKGVGIDPELLPHIFDLFTQAQRSLDRSQAGLSVGLTVVRKLVEMQRGAVQAYSKGLGQGSEFIVRLPLLTSATPRPEVAARLKKPVPMRVATWQVASLCKSLSQLLHTSFTHCWKSFLTCFNTESRVRACNHTARRNHTWFNPTFSDLLKAQNHSEYISVIEVSLVKTAWLEMLTCFP